MTVLLRSVGARAANLRADVLQVQTLLRSRGLDPGPLDGRCGPATIAAIRKFQGAFLRRPDGVVEPDGATWRRLTAGATPEPVKPDPWGGDSAKWHQDRKLRSMHPELRTRVQAVLKGLTLRNFQPRIFYAWRSVATQLEIYRKGNSKVTFSFHNAQRPDGTPNAYAADIVDLRYAWSARAESSGFWATLGEEARRAKLFWGGDWTSFRDWAHVQLVDNSQLARVRAESGL